MNVRVAIALASLAIATPQPAPAVVGPWSENPHSKVRLITPYAAAPRQGPFRFAVEFELQPGWHAYWRNSGDAGFPPVFDVTATPELAAARTLWPAPQRFVLPGALESFGYAERVTYPLESTIAATPDAAALALRLRADYLVCAIECVPYRYDLVADQPLAAAATADAATAAHIDAWRARVPRPVEAAEGGETWATASRAGDEWTLTVHLRDPPRSIDAFFDVHPVFEIRRGEDLRFRLTRHDANVPLPAASEFSWVAGPFDARQTVELAGAESGFRLRWPRWPILAAVLVAALALSIIVLGRKIP